MYMHRTRLAPALGKAPELRRLLADTVKHLHGQGQRLALSERIFSSEWPRFLVTHVAPEIADVEQVRRWRLTDADFRARVAQVMALSAEPARSSLWESVIDPPPNLPPTTIGQLTFFYPAIGKDRQMEGQLGEFVKELQTMGQLTSLWRRIYSSEGPMFQAVSRYADLADLDRSRKAAAPVRDRGAAALSDLSRAPVQRRLTETIVAMPPA